MKSETVKMAAARTCTILALACAAAAFLATAFLPARAVTTHYMPQADLAYSGGFITSEGALVFPGKTLADLEGCGFWGRIAGNAIAFVKTALSNAVKPYPAGAAGDAIERYDFDLVAHEGEHVKAVHIQLYNGEGGVWAKAVKAWYVKTGQSGMPTIHYTVDAATGELAWSGVSNMNIATSATAGGYGIRAIGVAQPLTTAFTLAFPGLTVSQIAKNAAAKLSVHITGQSIGDDLGLRATVVNPVVTAGTEAAPTALRCEAQFLGGPYVKCAAIELKDGEGGVYVRNAGGYYREGVELFCEPMLAANGARLDGVNTNPVPSTLLGGGYGLYNLEINEEARVEGDVAHVFDCDKFIGGTAQLVFPRATLAELEGCMFYGIMCGRAHGGGGPIRENIYTHIVKRYPVDAAEPVQKLFLQMTNWEGGHTKSVIVELTDGTGGVYGRIPLASYKSGNHVREQSFGITDDGSGVTLAAGWANQAVATYDDGPGYGIKKLGATRLAPAAPRLAFPGMRVADIFRGEILGRTAGDAMSNSVQCDPHAACNKVITSTDAATDEITGFRVEMQCSIGYIKCVELRFTNGEGGVYVQAVRACYANSPYATVGRMMIRQDDSARADGTSNGSLASTTFWSSGYGVCCLAAALPDDASTGPATAVWNGGDPSDAASWTCRAGDGTLLAGALPDKYTQVLIAAGVTMTTDADLTPYDSVMTTAAGFAIDVAGHKLCVKSLDPWHATTVTDTAGGGELHLAVPRGFQTYCNQIALSGKLKLVTEGEGLFLAAKTGQTYTGGTQVASGTLMYDAAPEFWPLGGNGMKNAGAQVVAVDGGATLDINGKTAFGYTTVVFNGGTVYGSTAQFNCAHRLEADSFLVATGDFKMQGGAFDLGGHRLSIDITYGKTLFWECQLTGPGAIDVTRGGWLNMTAGNIDASNVDFAIHCALNINKAVSIRDYYSYYDNEANTFDASAALNVHGTFTPASAYFTAATMMDGSTIDLSKKTEVWSTTSSSLNANTLQFAPGGTVKVEMGEREIDFGESGLVKIVSWAEKPAGVKFKTTVPKRYSLSPRDDGLYCVKTSGTVVFVR